MNDRQKLYPQLIYRINSVLSEIRDGLNIENLIAPSVFDPYRRIFQWLVVSEEKGRWDFNKEDLEKVKDMIEKNTNSWNEFKSEFKDGDQFIFKTVEEAFEIIESTNNKEEDFHHALLMLHQFYPVNPEKYIDGILRRNLIRRAKEREGQHKIDYATAELQIDKENTYTLYPWAKMEFYRGNNREGKKSCQENYPPWYPPDKADVNEDDPLPEMKSEDWYLKKKYYVEIGGLKCTPATPGKNHFYRNYIVPFFAGYKDFKLSEFLELTKKHVTAFRYFLIIPLYDAWIEQQYYGNLCGDLQIPFENEDLLEDFINNFIKNGKDNLIKSSPLIVQQIKEAAIHEILQQPIEVDFLEHFIKYLPLLQDWKRVMVWKKDVGKFIYCYKRDGSGSWKKCSNKNCNGCITSNLENKIGKCYGQGNDLHLSKNEISDGKPKQIVPVEKLLNNKFVPYLYTEDYNRYKDYVLVYEYPVYTVFPPDKNKLWLCYKREQIDLLRQLALQRRITVETVKHGTKAAVSAIISRNHSHHIGSHVTPRTTIEHVRKRLKEIYGNGLGNLDKAVAFLKDTLDEYIQKKADFTAEISTEHLQTTTNKRLFGEVMLRFLFNVLLMDSIAANEGITYQNFNGKWENKLKFHFLLDGEELYIKFEDGTSSLDLKYLKDFPDNPSLAWKDNGKGDTSPEDVLVAWPGPLGEYALYCFLENFIRNSAKHSSSRGKDLNIYLNLITKNHSYDFFKLQIWDDVTNPEKKVKKNKTEQSLWEWLQAKARERIVDEKGQLRKGFWGISEMKIMAMLLSGSSDFLSMEDRLRISCRKIQDKMRLVYELELMRPREIAIISPSLENAKELNERHNDKGVWWFDSVGAFVEQYRGSKSLATFEILIIDSKLLEEANKYKHLFPFRVIIDSEPLKQDTPIPGAVFSNDIITRCLRMNSPEEIIKEVWTVWVESRYSLPGDSNNRKKLCLVLFLGQRKDENPTNKWFSMVTNWNKNNKHQIGIVHKSSQQNLNLLNPDQVRYENDITFSIFDRHFEGYRAIEGNKDLLRKKLVFFEPIDKKSSDFTAIYFSEPSAKTIFQLIESSLLPILIIDERIAEVAYHKILESDGNKAEGLLGLRYRLVVARNAGIYLATHLYIFDDNSRSQPVAIHPSVETLSPRNCIKIKVSDNGIEGFSAYYCTEPDCNKCKGKIVKSLNAGALILHQNIADTLLKDTIEKNFHSQSFRAKFESFLEQLQKFIPFVAVESGRGIPADLPANAKFLPFSLIREYVMGDMISKYSLTRILMNLIRRG